MPSKKLAVIFGEPGAGSELEAERFASQKTSDDLLRAVDDFTYRCFRTGTYSGRPNPFHRRVASLLTEAFGSIEQAMLHCYFSNLTKCEKEGGAIPWVTRHVF